MHSSQQTQSCEAPAIAFDVTGLVLVILASPNHGLDDVLVAGSRGRRLVGAPYDRPNIRCLGRCLWCFRRRPGGICLPGNRSRRKRRRAPILAVLQAIAIQKTLELLDLALQGLNIFHGGHTSVRFIIRACCQLISLSLPMMPRGYLMDPYTSPQSCMPHRGTRHHTSSSSADTKRTPSPSCAASSASPPVQPPHSQQSKTPASKQHHRHQPQRSQRRGPATATTGAQETPSPSPPRPPPR